MLRGLLFNLNLFMIPQRHAIVWMNVSDMWQVLALGMIKIVLKPIGKRKFQGKLYSVFHSHSNYFCSYLTKNLPILTPQCMFYYRFGWSSIQNRLFNKMARILYTDQLSHLANSGHWNEPVLRRISVDKSSRRVRALFASISWDLKLTQWLHATLIDSLSARYLSSYLNILQVCA